MSTTEQLETEILTARLRDLLDRAQAEIARGHYASAAYTLLDAAKAESKLQLTPCKTDKGGQC